MAFSCLNCDTGTVGQKHILFCEPCRKELKKDPSHAPWERARWTPFDLEPVEFGFDESNSNSMGNVIRALEEAA